MASHVYPIGCGKGAVARFRCYIKAIPDGCLIWTAHVAKNGYARFREGGRGTRFVLCHRFIFESIFGPIPEDLVLDHACRNRSCVNVLHLEAVSQQENIQRGLTGRLPDGKWRKGKHGRFVKAGEVR